MKRVILLAAVLLGLGTLPAESAICAAYGWRQACNDDWPTRRCWRQRYCTHWQPNYSYRLPEREAYGYRSFELEGRAERRDCRDIRRTVGDQHLTVEGAKKASNDAWSALIRFHYGERWMDLNNARSITYTCSRSSIKEGGVTTLGQTLTRCELAAAPCSPAPEHEERER